MGKTNNQSGNVIEWLILGIVLIGVVVLVAWRYTETDKDQNAADQAVNSNQAVQPGALKIAAWKVELKQSAEFGTLSSTVYKTATDDEYMISSSKLAQGTWTCDTNAEHKAVLGRLSRSDTQDEAHTVKVGEKYYGFALPAQSNCFKETDLNSLGMTFSKDLVSLLSEAK